MRGEESVYQENAKVANITRLGAAAVGTGVMLASALGYVPPAVAFPVALVSCAALIGAGIRAQCAQSSAEDRAAFGNMLTAVGQQISGVADTPPAPPTPEQPPAEQPPAQNPPAQQ